LNEIMLFGEAKFPDALNRAGRAFGLPPAPDELDMQLFTPWLAYCFKVADGRTLAEHFLAKRGPYLPPDDRTWVEEQADTPLSVWEIEEVRVGEGMTMVDLFTGARHVVVERTGSKSLRVRDGVLGRVAFDGTAYGIFGLYMTSLPPRETAAVVDEMKRLAKWSRLPIAKEELVASDAAVALVQLWRRHTDELWAAPRPELRNTDGDPLLMIEDTYVLPPSERTAALAALEAAGLDRAPDEDGAARFTMVKRKRSGDLDVVTTAFITVGKDELVVATNSRKRASAARRKLATILDATIHHASRTETNPLPPPDLRGPTESRGRAKSPGDPSDALPPEALEAVRAFKAEHWRRWVDEPVPALGGSTPRTAVKTAKGRAEVELLLKEAERYESADGPATRFDVQNVRIALGIGR
jgi:hypothetical protein